jgi:dihydroorotate dehydrogenase (fumarate)
VHTATDVVKAVMAGAHAVQVVSALLQKGPGYLRQLRDELSRWLEEHEYESLGQMRGSMNLAKSPDPMAYQRGNYIHVLQGWKA